MKHYGYKGFGPIGYNNNGLINPLKVTTCSNRDNTGLGFKKILFHFGINKFILEPESLSEHESKVEFDILEGSDDDEDPYPYPIPHDLAKFFAKLDDFVPQLNSMDSTSDSPGNTTDAYHVQPKQEESSQFLNIEYLSKNLEEEGEWVPITLGEFYNILPYSTDSNEYEFDSF